MLTSSRVLHPNLPITYVVSCRLAPRVRPRLCGKSAGPAAPPLRASPPQSSGGMQRFGGEELGGPCTNHRRSSETGNISPTPSWRNILIYTPCWAGWEGSCFTTSWSLCTTKGIAHACVLPHLRLGWTLDSNCIVHMCESV